MYTSKLDSSFEKAKFVEATYDEMHQNALREGNPRLW